MLEIKKLNVSVKENKILNDLTLSIKTGESFGLVGESGSGKSTIARLVAGLVSTDKGRIKLFDKEVF